MGQAIQNCCHQDNIVTTTAAPVATEEKPADPTPAPAPAPEAKSEAKPEPSNQEEHEMDKIALRQLTTEFVQDVIKGGIPCEVLSLESTERTAATYSLDRSLRTFYLTKGKEQATPYKIVNIRDIWIGKEFVQFQKSVWASELSNADKEKVIAVQFQEQGGKRNGSDEEVILLMERDRTTAVRFVQAMTILRLYNSGTADANK
jgi:hypothetical protein